MLISRYMIAGEQSVHVNLNARPRIGLYGLFEDVVPLLISLSDSLVAELVVALGLKLSPLPAPSYRCRRRRTLRLAAGH
jgi:hypothetical protein